MHNHRDVGRSDAIPGEIIDPEKYLPALETAGVSAGFHFHHYGKIEGFALPYLTRNLSAPILWYLSAGIHGDEPAGPWAILQALEQNIFPENIGWVVFPMLNPIGLQKGKRENGNGVDLNRDYRQLREQESYLHTKELKRKAWHFEGALSFHEDWEAVGAYVYEHNPENRPSPVLSMIESLRVCCGLESATVIDGWEVSRLGLIQPPSDPHKRSYWPEQVFLLHEFTGMSYTIETPSVLDLETRAQAHISCLQAVGHLYQ